MHKSLLWSVYCLLLQNDFGITALVPAVVQGHTEIVEILVKAGANVNFRTKVRPLMIISH